MEHFITINDKEFSQISELVYDRFGIKLSDQKKALVTGRLNKSLKRFGLKSFSEYYTYLLSDSTGVAINELINRISTNHTYFYREEKHFEFLTKKALPDIKKYLISKNNRDLRVWCAGCSTGEEPYTLAIQMMEFFEDEYRSWNGGVLATDISGHVLDIAKKGVYSFNQLKKLPENLLKKYFIKIKDDQYRVSDSLKKEVLFKRLNLINDTFPFRQSFQIIFCRNVMIYFDLETRNKLIQNFHKFMIPGGYLFIGHSETIGREQNMFKYIQPAIYQKI